MNKSLNQKVFLFFFHSIKMNLLAHLGPFTDDNDTDFPPLQYTWKHPKALLLWPLVRTFPM